MGFLSQDLGLGLPRKPTTLLLHSHRSPLCPGTNTATYARNPPGQLENILTQLPSLPEGESPAEGWPPEEKPWAS